MMMKCVVCSRMTHEDVSTKSSRSGIIVSDTLLSVTLSMKYRVSKNEKSVRVCEPIISVEKVLLPRETVLLVR